MSYIKILFCLNCEISFFKVAVILFYLHFKESKWKSDFSYSFYYWNVSNEIVLLAWSATGQSVIYIDWIVRSRLILVVLTLSNRILFASMVVPGYYNIRVQNYSWKEDNLFKNDSEALGRNSTYHNEKEIWTFWATKTRDYKGSSHFNNENNWRQRVSCTWNRPPSYNSDFLLSLLLFKRSVFNRGPKYINSISTVAILHIVHSHCGFTHGICSIYKLFEECCFKSHANNF